MQCVVYDAAPPLHLFHDAKLDRPGPSLAALSADSIDFAHEPVPLQGRIFQTKSIVVFNSIVLVLPLSFSCFSPFISFHPWILTETRSNPRAVLDLVKASLTLPSHSI